jgi:hypothetical protein
MTPDETSQMWRELESTPWERMNECHAIEIGRLKQEHAAVVASLESRIIRARIDLEDSRDRLLAAERRIDRLWLGLFAAGLWILYLIGGK